WAVYPGSGAAEEKAVQHFYGICASQVECALGSGMGMAATMTASSEPATVPLALAPVLWNLEAAGFSGAAEVFNGNHLLRLRHTIGGYCVWDNDGDGADEPRVELRCESPSVHMWQLSFHHKKKEAAEYTHPAKEWAPLGANDMRLSKPGGYDRGTLPA